MSSMRNEVDSQMFWGFVGVIGGILIIVDPTNFFWYYGIPDWTGIVAILGGALCFFSSYQQHQNLATCTACRNEIHKDAALCQHCGTKFG